MVLPQITTNYGPLYQFLPFILKKKKEYLNTTTLKLLFTYKLWKVTATKKGLLPSTANVFILTHRLGGVAVFWLIPGGSVCSIPAVAVSFLVIHATEMEERGGGGGSGSRW